MGDLTLIIGKNILGNDERFKYQMLRSNWISRISKW